MNQFDIIRHLVDGPMRACTGSNKEQGQCVFCLSAIVRPLMALWVGTEEKGSICRQCSHKYFGPDGEHRQTKAAFFVSMDGMLVRRAHSSAEGYTVQNHRGPLPDGAWRVLRDLEDCVLGVGESLYVRADVWGSGSVETHDGHVIAAETYKNTALEEYLSFSSPGGDE